MKTSENKEVLTTGEVARICHVAPRTVSKWFDTGKLRGYRIPGSRDRRIPRQQLVAFMRAHGIPLDGLDGGSCRILLVDPGSGNELTDRLNDTGQYELRSAVNGFEAGVTVQQFRPHAILVAVDADADDARAICRNVKSNPDLRHTAVIAVISGGDRQRAANLLADGFNEVLCRPVLAEDLAAAVRRVTDLVT